MSPSEKLFHELVAVEADECVIWPLSKMPDGYGRLNHYRNGARRTVRVHSAALELRVGPRPAGMDAAHGPCRNRACMNYRHLRWATRAENMADARRDGTWRRGPALLAKVTEEQVVEIRRRREAGEQLTAIAADFGVSRQCVGLICQRVNWAWVA